MALGAGCFVSFVLGGRFKRLGRSGREGTDVRVSECSFEGIPCWEWLLRLGMEAKGLNGVEVRRHLA